jgi:hypothetical protein
VYPYAFLRVANWSPDAPAVDICLKAHGGSTFVGPLVAAVADGGTIGEAGASGLTFPLVSSYLPLSPGAYDVRVVAAGSTACTAPVLPDVTTLPTLSIGTGTTVALVGETLPAGSDPGLKVVWFSDEIVGTGPLRVRCINADPAIPLVDFGYGTLMVGNYNSIFPAVPFGQASAAIEQDAMASNADQNGYVAIQPFVHAVISAHPTGATHDAVTTSPISSLPGNEMTFVIVAGTSPLVPAIVQCVDNAGIAGALSDCRVMH